MKVEALSNINTPCSVISQGALSANVGLGDFFGTTKQLQGVLFYNRRTKLKKNVDHSVSNIFSII